VTMPPRLRKFALIAHVAFSVATFGAVAAFLALAIAGLLAESGRMASAVYIAMDLVVRSIIVPLVAGALVTGLIQSLGTSWGLIRHWWVVAKLTVTICVAIVLLLQLSGIAQLAEAALASDLAPGDFRQLRWSPVVHAAGGLAALFVPLALSIYKPPGMTRYGWRKAQEAGQGRSSGRGIEAPV